MKKWFLSLVVCFVANPLFAQSQEDADNAMAAAVSAQGAVNLQIMTAESEFADVPTEVYGYFTPGEEVTEAGYVSDYNGSMEDAEEDVNLADIHMNNGTFYYLFEMWPEAASEYGLAEQDYNAGLADATDAFWDAVDREWLYDDAQELANATATARAAANTSVTNADNAKTNESSRILISHQEWTDASYRWFNDDNGKGPDIAFATAQQQADFTNASDIHVSAYNTVMDKIASATPGFNQSVTDFDDADELMAGTDAELAKAKFDAAKSGADTAKATFDSAGPYNTSAEISSGQMETLADNVNP